MSLLARLVDLYSLLVLASVILSWVPTRRSHPIAQFIETVTEPPLRVIRSVLPSFGGIDLSPMVLLLALRVLERLLM